MVAKASLALLLVAAVASADDKRYTIADLETLVADGAFKEALVHAADVAPAQRTGRWTDASASAATGVLASMPVDDGSAIVAIDTIDRELPQLLKSARYLKVRGELGVKSLAGCFQRSDDCGPLATRLVDGDRSLAVAVAKVTTAWNADTALALWRRALDAKPCKTDELKRAMVTGLGRAPDSTPAGDARAIMTTCWDQMKDAVVKAFDDAGKGGYVYKNTCETLAAKRMLSSLQAKRCKS